MTLKSTKTPKTISLRRFPEYQTELSVEGSALNTPPMSPTNYQTNWRNLIMTESRRLAAGDYPAFPNDSDPSGYGFNYGLGMSKREHYAALFLAGLCSNATLVSSIKTNELLDCAVSLADRLVAKLAEADRGDA